MAVDGERLVRRLLGGEWGQLNARERAVVLRIARRVRNANREFEVRRSLGERAADALATFGGSWAFIGLFVVVLVGWTALNTEVLGPRHAAFDPYPYVFLNLMLSMLAAMQAPIILMSQNRQAARDRLDADIDHEVNVRAEMAVRSMHRRLSAIEAALRAGRPAGDAP